MSWGLQIIDPHRAAVAARRVVPRRMDCRPRGRRGRRYRSVLRRDGRRRRAADGRDAGHRRARLRRRRDRLWRTHQRRGRRGRCRLAGRLPTSGRTSWGSDMNLTCPSCGADMDLDVLLAHEDSRRALAQLVTISMPLGRRVLQYLRLFKPATRAMSHGRTVKLIEQLLPDVQRGAITHKGRDWDGLHAGDLEPRHRPRARATRQGQAGAAALVARLPLRRDRRHGRPARGRAGARDRASQARPAAHGAERAARGFSSAAERLQLLHRSTTRSRASTPPACEGRDGSQEAAARRVQSPGPARRAAMADAFGPDARAAAHRAQRAPGFGAQAPARRHSPIAGLQVPSKTRCDAFELGTAVGEAHLLLQERSK